jgi:Cu2+-exporting ATPase
MQAVSAQRVGPDGALRSIPAREVAVGDLLFLAAGERAAVDGVIEDGVSELDRSLVTGESAPAPARVGDAIHAGSVNLTRPIRMRATATVDASTVAELARLIEAGEQGRAGHVRLADRAARLYVPVVHTAAALTFIGWFFLGGADWRIALMNAAAVLIITCPCALGLAVPAVQVVATGRLFKRGVFVKSGDALERLSQIDHVVMDKTGTLTMGRPRLVSAPDEALLSKAAMLARASRHPLSRALVDAAGCGAVAEGAIERQGQGVEGTVDGRMAKLGSAAFVGAAAINALNPAESELWFAFVGEPPVRFGFRDVLRPDAVEAVKALRARGFAVEISSGDRADAVREAARALEIEVAAGQRTPQQKIARLEALRAEGKRPLMVGDGLNDAAALAAASASASPGAAVDAAQAASDIVFQSERLSPLVEAIDVARAARKRVWENLWFSALYNVIAAPAAMAGLVTPLIAALAMAGSSLVVTLNALRLRGQAE